MILWIIRAQWPILEQILRRGCKISVKEKKKRLQRKVPCQLFRCATSAVDALDARERFKFLLM
jgi:hypothetical protein